MSLTARQMRELAEVSNSHRLVAPSAEAIEAEAAAAPAVAKPTGGPNRATFYVPTEHTTFSMGQPGPAWIPDPGITAKTDNHIHWFTVGVADPKNNTLVTLGRPPNAHAMEAEVGPATLRGYGMVTSGNAWHDAKFQHVILSRKHDVTIRSMGEGKAVGIQSDAGRVLLGGKENVTVVSPAVVKIGAHPDISMVNIGYEASWGKEWFNNLGSKIGSTLATLGEVVTSAIAVQGAWSGKLNYHSDDGLAGWSAKKAVGGVKAAVDLGLLGSTVVRGIAEFAGAEPAGSVGISGQKFVSLTAGIGATMYGQVASAIVSYGQAEVLGGVSALVKGIAWTEIAGGVGTALTAIGDVEIGAAHGEVEITAKKAVYVTSETEHVLCIAKEWAQLTSVDGHAVLHGKESSYVGAGGAEGFGVEVKEGKLSIGETTAGNKFDAPAFKADNSITMEKTFINLTQGDSSIRMNKSSMLLHSKQLNLEIDGVAMQIKDGKILLG